MQHQRLLDLWGVGPEKKSSLSSINHSLGHYFDLGNYSSNLQMNSEGRVVFLEWEFNKIPFYQLIFFCFFDNLFAFSEQSPTKWRKCA